MPRKRDVKHKPVIHDRKRKKRSTTSKTDEDSDEIIEEITEKQIFIFQLEDVQLTRTKAYQHMETVSPSKVKLSPIITHVPHIKNIYTYRIQYETGSLLIVTPSSLPVEQVEPKGFFVSNISTSQLTYQSPIMMIEPTEKIVSFQVGIPIMSITSTRLPTINIERSVENMLKERYEEEDEIEIDETDPFFHWPGGVAYASRKPWIIVNVATEKGKALKMLQILLRDAYTEMVGGKPNAYPVEFIANEPRIPEICGNIITLDLTEEGWGHEISIQGDSKVPKIIRGGYDIIPKLKEISQNLFTGDLGYLIINIPNTWERSAEMTLMGQEQNYADLLVRYLGAGTSEKYLSSIISSHHRKDKQKGFKQNIKRYWGLKIDGNFSPPEAESIYYNNLYQNDWRRVAITKRQKNGEESDEHYFLKAAITEGIWHHLWKIYRRTKDKKISYKRFMQETISENLVLTEAKIENNDPIADILLQINKEDWIKMGMRGFFEPSFRSSKATGKIYIEVETGRSEGGFNFRKVREKLENYGNERNNLCIVIPPRLLFRGKRRAKMIVRLTIDWSHSNGSAKLMIPIFNKKRCKCLKVVTEKYITRELYRSKEVK